MVRGITKIWVRNDCSRYFLSWSTLSSPSVSGHFCPEKKNFTIKKHSWKSCFHLYWKLRDISVPLSFKVGMTIRGVWRGWEEGNFPREKTGPVGWTRRLLFTAKKLRTPTMVNWAGPSCSRYHINGPLSWVGLFWTSSHHSQHNPSPISL